jgi:hypothetical protein
MATRLLVLLALLVIPTSGCGSVQPPDYYVGYREGQVAAREIIQKGPISSRFFNAITPTGGLGKKEKSVDWNAGFQDGWTAEFKK